ncbi:hypothetical protein Sme01_15040 [Sphaerisporangium melleum]|uniref:DUF397 domain-containing protein n=1 Tax=Sphaerisporangium melleum TaxID=321316 RepID=A0A917QV01_9ACTN|nr:DUF397 domain-containing protein [Sphaerisporangium melleum]GGK69490.1 hypothetical protein GCM10007964_10640 [Sphaerisporangium melleum]GII69028.1 hypothetical protein Sme01_15040 [Sphaerisporangium melleum]
MDDLIEDLANARWRKSSFSGHDGSNCVEVARFSGGRHGVRDSKDLGREALVVGPTEWAVFLNQVKAQ